jgi:hypothetical protein
MHAKAALAIGAPAYRGFANFEVPQFLFCISFKPLRAEDTLPEIGLPS